MKRIVAILMTGLILLTLSACGHEHDVNVGICSTCGEFQNQDLVTSIKNKLSEANSELNIALSYMSSSNDNNSTVYNAIINMQTYIDNSKTYLNEAKDMCGEYKELNSTKNAINTAINKIPSIPSNSSTSSLENYLDNLKLYVAALAEAQLKILYVK